eukprot:TRINITY_DN5175_c0_g1_i1.p1 TRINITY_DN5175_c0_g1~~TRINITY_DN5175_c0_g1_i1.p1  ORF type:complete len:258 (-),score=46.98 TRINITY_DN5175_c0_g1_i1:128-901(-)
MYNGPRAGINLNDGLAGGNRIQHNLLFNWVRETNDHGPINSWDRVPFRTTMGDPLDPTGVRPQYTNITRNLIINWGSSGLGTTGGLWNLDHDDGSGYYDDSLNVLVYAGSKNYLGDHKRFIGNLYLYPDAGFSGTGFCHHVCSDYFSTDSWRPDRAQPWGEHFAQNTCVMRTAQTPPVRLDAGVNSTRLDWSVPLLDRNVYYLVGGEDDYVLDAGRSNTTWQKVRGLGREVGSRIVTGAPEVSEMMMMAREILQMHC